jgi:HD-like signal output (HDOD) protein
MGTGEDAFTAMLLSDVALPVLLCSWGEYYVPVVEEWRSTSGRLSEIERRHFDWDHAQAGSWILQSWDFPEEMVCFVGAHNLSLPEIAELGLDQSIAVPIAASALIPSLLKSDTDRGRVFLTTMQERLEVDEADLQEILDEARNNFEEIRGVFGLCGRELPELSLEGLTQDGIPSSGSST